MTRLFFVHGTGVRRAGYEQTLSDIKKGLAKAGRGDIEVAGVSWGEQAGVKVTAQLIEQMLPPGAAKGEAPTDPEREAALWATLMDDPLFELRVVALRPREPTEMLPGQPLPSEAFKRKLRNLALSDAPLPGEVAPEALRAAADWLADGEGSPVATEAATAAGSENDPALIEAAARALVAYALAISRGEPGTGPDALYLREERAALVEQVEKRLTEGVMGIDDWLRDKLKEWALAKATAYGKDRRTGLMTAVSPGTGDILLTQRRGEAVQQLLKSEIEKLQDDVAVIGHSLGGVHLVNLLSGPDRPKNVTKLITVGSQAAFFTACDAMATLRLGKALEPSFAQWLNFYDRNDFLSFCAARSFTGGKGIIDVEVTSGMPFPDSHGAYWRMPKVYEDIVQFLSEA